MSQHYNGHIVFLLFYFNDFLQVYIHMHAGGVMKGVPKNGTIKKLVIYSLQVLCHFERI